MDIVALVEFAAVGESEVATGAPDGDKIVSRSNAVELVSAKSGSPDSVVTKTSVVSKKDEVSASASAAAAVVDKDDEASATELSTKEDASGLLVGSCGMRLLVGEGVMGDAVVGLVVGFAVNW
jgi:hypothetical protein